MLRRTLLQAALMPLTGMEAPAVGASALPSASLRRSDAERYWSRLRAEQFVLPKDFTFLNNGTLGVPPRVVISATIAGLMRSASLSSATLNRWGAPIENGNARTFAELRASLADFLRCTSPELTLTHNTTEALRMLADGLELAEGDEVVITDQEHFANMRCWQDRAARTGIVVKVAPIPTTPASSREIVDAFEKSLGQRTRIVSFAGITTRSGLCLPIKEIVNLARARRIITIVDGAHMPGQVHVDLKALGCDYFAASPHKWMFAPAGSGLLFGRGERLEKLADALSPSTRNNNASGAERLMQVGTNNGAVFDGYAAALQFLQAVGPMAVYERVRLLGKRTREEASSLPDVVLVTPDDPSLYAGMVTFAVRNVDLRQFGGLFHKHRIRVEAGRNAVRISTHIHTRMSDIARFFETLRAGLASR